MNSSAGLNVTVNSPWRRVHFCLPVKTKTGQNQSETRTKHSTNTQMFLIGRLSHFAVFVPSSSDELQEQRTVLVQLGLGQIQLSADHVPTVQTVQLRHTDDLRSGPDPDPDRRRSTMWSCDTHELTWTSLTSELVPVQES